MIKVDPRGRIPLWLKIAFTLFMVIWVPSYALSHGPVNFLWFCDLANFILLFALWLESPLLISSQAVGVLLIQLIWVSDFFSRLLLGSHLLGGTEYMFDDALSLGVRTLSLFHVFVPVVLVWAVLRLGHHAQGWRLQAAFAMVVFPLSLLPDPELNINWLRKPFGIEQIWLPAWGFCLLCMIVVPLALYWPSHHLVAFVDRRFHRRALPRGDAQ